MIRGLPSYQGFRRHSWVPSHVNIQLRVLSSPVVGGFADFTAPPLRPRSAKLTTSLSRLRTSKRDRFRRIPFVPTFLLRPFRNGRGSFLSFYLIRSPYNRDQRFTSRKHTKDVGFCIQRQKSVRYSFQLSLNKACYYKL